MSHPYWPLFDLRVRTPRLELRYVDDDLGTALMSLASEGIHDPSFMPFAIPWTDFESPHREQQGLQYYWRCRADVSPQRWDLPFAVIAEGTVVGTTSIVAENFPTLRQFTTGSWLGRAYQGTGLGKELRVATLQLGFQGFAAEIALTAAFFDNGPSLGVTRSLGYTETGPRRMERRGAPADMMSFRMAKQHWASQVRRDDITMTGVEACLDLLGIPHTGD